MDTEVERKLAHVGLDFLFSHHPQGLDGTIYTHEDVFLLLVAMASSKRDVVRLHNLLPTNSQLPPEHLRRLKDLWQLLHPKGASENPRTIEDEQALQILHHLCGREGLWYLYARLLQFEGRSIGCIDPSWDPAIPQGFRAVAYHTGRRRTFAGKETEELDLHVFTCTILGIPFAIYLCYDATTLRLIAEVKTQAKDLDLRKYLVLAPWIRAIPAGRSACCHKASGPSGHREVPEAVSFYLDATVPHSVASLLTCVDSHRPTMGPYRGYIEGDVHIVQKLDLFHAFLGSLMHQSGVPDAYFTTSQVP